MDDVCGAAPWRSTGVSAVDEVGQLLERDTVTRAVGRLPSR
jgi:hypothetical protein